MRFISRWRFRQLVSRRRPASNRTLSRFEELEKRETPAALGVYALGNAYSTGDSLDPYFLQQARANANVDGIALRAKWDALESTDGQFTWNYFDTQVADATAAHKEVSLSVEAGTSTPPWVYADGVPAFNGSQKVPIPWNATYLNKWEQFIQALGQRYAGNPTVVQVKITGINSISQETALPYDSSSSADLNAWLAAGYTRTKVENAWTQIADTVARQFPQQQVAAMFRPDAFPPIDSNGRVIKDTSGQPAKADYQATTDLMTNGRSRYGVQFVIQNNALSPCFVWQNVVNLSQQVTTGYQMLGAVTSDPAMTQCQSPPLAENVALQDAVNNAIKATPVNQAVPGNAKFLEIYAADVAAANQDSTLNAVLANAHTNLASHFSVGAPASIASGTSFSLTVTAQNTANVSAGEYPGRVHFTSADPQASLPADYTFTAADTGVHSFTVTLRTGSGATITVTDVATQAITGSTTINLLPVVTRVSPASGSTSGGTVVTITGLSFSGVKQVLLGTVSASFHVVSPTKITATTPRHVAGTVQVRLVTLQGESPVTPADQFTYVAGPTGPTGPGGPKGGPAELFTAAAAVPAAQEAESFASTPSPTRSLAEHGARQDSLPTHSGVSPAAWQALDAYWAAAHRHPEEALEPGWEDARHPDFLLLAE